MKSLFLVTTLLFTPLSPALAGHHGGPSVEAFIQDYFDRFNATTLEANPEQSFTFPAVFINDGKVRVIQDASVKVFDYEVIRASGWGIQRYSTPLSYTKALTQLLCRWISTGTNR